MFYKYGGISSSFFARSINLHCFILTVGVNKVTSNQSSPPFPMMTTKSQEGNQRDPSFLMMTTKSQATKAVRRFQ